CLGRATSRNSRKNTPQDRAAATGAPRSGALRPCSTAARPHCRRHRPAPRRRGRGSAVASPLPALLRGEVAAPSRRVRGMACCSPKTLAHAGRSGLRKLTAKLRSEEPLTPTPLPAKGGARERSADAALYNP